MNFPPNVWNRAASLTAHAHISPRGDSVFSKSKAEAYISPNLTQCQTQCVVLPCGRPLLHCGCSGRRSCIRRDTLTLAAAETERQQIQSSFSTTLL